MKRNVIIFVVLKTEFTFSLQLGKVKPIFFINQFSWSRMIVYNAITIVGD